MNFNAVCRTCLTTEYLNPIFVKSVDHKRYSTAIFITTGIKVDIDDGLPQKMCVRCVNFLNSSLKFRKQCKDTEARLLQIKNECYVTDKNSGDEDEDEDFYVKDVALEVKFEEESRIDDGEVIVKSEAVEDKESDALSRIKSSQCTPKQGGGAKTAPNCTNTLLGDSPRCGRRTKQQYGLGSCSVRLERLPVGDLHRSKPCSSMQADPSASDLTAHDRSHTGEKPCSCDICNRHFDPQANPPSKERHHRKQCKTIKVEKISRIACLLCQKDLSVRSIDAHMAKYHPGADERRVKCELCDSYVTKEKMNRHIKMMHGNRELRCGYCKSVFDEKEVLVDHVAKCTAKKKKRKISESGRELTQCEVCHKTMQRASLRSHVAVKHRGLGPVCEHCGRKFGNRLRLSEHLRAKHGYEKFKCQHCEFTSASIAALRNHERRHRGEKPFVCEQCGAKFHAAYLLAQHKQSHRTEKRVKCSLCLAVFKAGNSLHAHRLAVHGGALHRCPLCARAYSCRHYAVKHMRSVHQYKGPVPTLQVVPNPTEM